MEILLLTGRNGGVLWRRVDADDGHRKCYGAYGLAASNMLVSHSKIDRLGESLTRLPLVVEYRL